MSNTALLGLVIGAYPSISDKEMNSKKLVSHHLIIILHILSIFLILLLITIVIPQIPSLLLIILIALLDWTDGDTWLVLLFKNVLSSLLK